MGKVIGWVNPEKQAKEAPKSEKKPRKTTKE